jgi:uncharacterized membrane protein HdeD (DUF308 family)
MRREMPYGDAVCKLAIDLLFLYWSNMSTQPISTAQSSSNPSIALAVILIVCGCIAIAVPIFASVAMVSLFAWLVLLDGVIQLVEAFRPRGAARRAWKVLVGLLYLGVGLWLIMHPLLGVVGLTFVLTLFLFAEGIMDVTFYLVTTSRDRSPWMLLDGIITIVLAIMIARHWPSSSWWAIGILVGVSILMTGFTRLMIALSLRRRGRQKVIALGDYAA